MTANMPSKRKAPASHYVAHKTHEPVATDVATILARLEIRAANCEAWSEHEVGADIRRAVELIRRLDAALAAVHRRSTLIPASSQQSHNGREA